MATVPTAPRTWVAGEYPTAAQFNNDIRDWINFLRNPPACRVYHSAGQSVANDTSVALSFDSERYDTDAMHSPTVSNSRITINTAGLYLVTAHVSFGAHSDFIRAQVFVRLNGTTPIAVQQTFPEQGGFTVGVELSIATVYKFAAGGYIEILAAQRNTAATARSTIVAANYSPEFSATWIGFG